MKNISLILLIGLTSLTGCATFQEVVEYRLAHPRPIVYVNTMPNNVGLPNNVIILNGGFQNVQ